MIRQSDRARAGTWRSWGWVESKRGARSLSRGIYVPLKCSFDQLLDKERRTIKKLVLYCRVDCLP